jgi:lipopolysaccharide transport system permease protein
MHFVNIILYFTKSKIETESNRSFLGYLWWIIDPLISLGIYFLLFKVFLNSGADDYIPFLFLGLLTWKWLESSAAKSSFSILNELHIIRKINIHKAIFPLSEICYQTWKFIIVFG